ncbi:hypothetical protein CFL01nite_21230 [Corynebacterium flavescens]|uniref:Uncharacterized protein n=1 Tax=Corynebacterium flavescens TaxID=28028 RepID=A0AB73BA44_CORFL|nr:hypothetical protein CFL01nite_21230 [Corynebacterium flavescens]
MELNNGMPMLITEVSGEPGTGKGKRRHGISPNIFDGTASALGYRHEAHPRHPLKATFRPAAQLPGDGGADGDEISRLL